MINQFVYGGICFILGGCVGGFIVGHSVSKESKKRLDELDKRNKALIDEVSDLRDKNIKKRENKIKKEEKQVEKTIDSLRKPYSKAVDLDDDIDAIEDELCLKEYDIPDSNPHIERIPLDDNDIKLISHSEYKSLYEYSNVENVSFIYYQPNGMLVDEEGMIITNEEAIIGSDAMDIIDDTSSDYLYVHDTQNGIIYEIEIDHIHPYEREHMEVSESDDIIRDLAGAHV